MTIEQMEAMGAGWDETINGELGTTMHWRRRYTPPAGIHFSGSGWASKGN